MKSVLPLLCSLFLALAGSAPAQGIVWTADSPSAFGVTITGTGGFFNGNAVTNYAGWGVTLLTSPSGLWSFNGNISAVEQYSGVFGRDGIQISQSSSYMFFNPYGNGRKLIYPGYGDNVPFSHPHDANSGSTGNSLNPSDPFDFWTGQFSFDITNIPDQNLPQTWAWVITISGSGPTLVPEPATGSLVLLGAAGIGLFFRSKHRPSRDCQRVEEE
jgi:hypothetical protein